MAFLRFLACSLCRFFVASEELFMNCLLCNSGQVSLITAIPAERIIAEWYGHRRIDISAELAGHEHVELYECRTCHLRFFPPELAGSDQLYAQLQLFDWYYMPRKWEYDVAVQDIGRNSRLLEVGCGVGDFIQCLLGEKQIDAFGIEINTDYILHRSQPRGC